MSKHTDDKFTLPILGESPESFLAAHHEWIEEENDNQCDNVIALTVTEFAKQ